MKEPETPQPVADEMQMPPAETQMPPANPFAERLKKSYPDREFANDDEVNAALMEHLDGLEGYKSSTSGLHSKLAEVLDAVPELAGIIRDVSKGASFAEALSRNVDLEDITPIEGDPDYEAWNKNLETRKAGKQSMQENLEMSAAEMRAFAEENGMAAEDATKFLGAVDALIGEVVSGKIKLMYHNCGIKSADRFDCPAMGYCIVGKAGKGNFRSTERGGLRTDVIAQIRSRYHVNLLRHSRRTGAADYIRECE